MPVIAATSLEPVVHIRSAYVDVENTILNKRDICAYQTEQLTMTVENFPQANAVTYTWASDNDSVLSVDSNGLVTYTGVAGTANVTLTVTSTVADTDKTYPTASATVAINVIGRTIKTVGNYYLTDSFVPGETYIFASSNVEGSGYILTNTQYNTTYMTGKAVNIESNSADVYITESDDNNAYLCIESSTEDFYYFKNVATGKYLALVADPDVPSNRRVTTTSDLTQHNSESYLITYMSNDQTVYSLASSKHAYGRNVLKYTSYFLLSSEIKSTYIYQLATEKDIEPVAQIRVSSWNGNKDITNVLRYDYNIKENDTEQMLSYTQAFVDVDSVVWSVSDETIATIDQKGLVTYTGQEGFVTVKMEVTGTAPTGEKVTREVATTIHTSPENFSLPTENYPQFPHEGSVRANKTASSVAGGHNFQTSGVTEVELSVTGVPLTQPVDVVVVFDHSDSMSVDDRLEEAIADTRDFALQVVNSNSLNRIAIVTFDRYRGSFNTFESKTPNLVSNPEGTEDRIVTGDGTAAGAFVNYENVDELVSQIDSLSTNIIGGTNYDYGLQQCYDILKAAKSDPDANKKQYVVFMSDGEPYCFNRLNDIYNKSNGEYEAWLRGDDTNEAMSTYLNDVEKYPAAEYFNPDGENWFAAAIKSEEGTYLSSMPDVDYYDDYREGLGATMFTIGYRVGKPGTITNEVLTTMASSPDNFYYADGTLQKAYDNILDTIVYAANDARVTDIMGENFNLQVASSYTIGNGGETITLDPAPKIEVGSWSLNSNGTRNIYTAVETITFETNANGDLTAAYSNLLGDTNIYDVASNQIIGKNITYNVLSETFKWNIGDITRDEMTLKYYAYLEGAAEGEREGGIYATNESAVLEYVNYIGTECQQVFPVPSLAWDQAAINYEFYLVNKQGEPVNAEGIVVPFSERVLIGRTQTREIYLNTSYEYSAYTLIADEEIPSGYQLFNPNTSYSIFISSKDDNSSITINDEMSVYTTYFRDGTTTVNGHGEVQDVTDYTNTHVSFAVVYSPGIVPDSVVIDYGLPVAISVLENDISVPSGNITAIGKVLKTGTELNETAYYESQLTDGVTSGLVLDNGTAYIDGSKIVFTPSNLEMSQENVFYYEYMTVDNEYYYSTVTVIPAANIYYEESFFTFKDGDGYSWKTAGETFTDKFQAEDRPGSLSFSSTDADNVYGDDSAYNNSITYSLGSSKYTSVDANSPGKEPTAEFTFCGTGFDLFSVTNSNTGAVLVSIYKTDGKIYKNYIVDTYYGYSYEEETFKPNPESTEVLYQVPVISARELGYGTYKVVIKPLYSRAFDVNYDETVSAENNSYDIYIDSVRIYNPAGETPDINSVVGDAYLQDGEYAAEYLEVRRNILKSQEFYDKELEGTEFGKGSVFIDSIGSVDSTGISDKFLEAGPNNEVYLAKGQAIAFHIVSDTPLSLSSVQLGMKVIKGGEANVTVMNTKHLSSYGIKVSGAHEMHKKLSSVIVWDQDLLAQGIYQTKYPIIIANTSDAIIALTDLKWAYSEAPEAAATGMTLAVTSSTPAQALYATQNALITENVISAENVTVEWDENTVKEGKNAVLYVTTSTEVVKVTVDGVQVTDCKIDENGNKCWSYTVETSEIGSYSYDVVVYDENDNCGEPIETETLTVNEKTIFDRIIEFLNSIIKFIWGKF